MPGQRESIAIDPGEQHGLPTVGFVLGGQFMVSIQPQGLLLAGQVSVMQHMPVFVAPPATWSCCPLSNAVIVCFCNMSFRPRLSFFFFIWINPLVNC
jgi:hypothetical protein